ncbi:putative GDSL-like lipase acylhydrolase [Rosellinia necatrix]|uniref:Putative GDSL-like lipase acylhydrolase n=1 Tax=Rosellinia necatrix TaxID=77044 RepID=A0A1W2TR43_ROSNE|nr:putative GDSL-like lipase acylhydrolase [Rosellinia necatrix]
MKSTLLSALVPALAAAANPPAFILAGDSTTAVQAANGGGWGNGFISFLKSPATGVNKGHNGATTKSFVEGGDWATVKGLVGSSQASGHDVYVTIQFGHNDQKSTSGVTLAQFQTNLVNLAKDVLSWGATPLLVTPLTRRTFSGGSVEDSLHDERLATIAAAGTAAVAYLDLNAASIAYVDAIGEAAAHAYNLNAGDNTHLGAWGSVVFGRLVADLLLERRADLAPWFLPNQTLSDEIRDGLPA